MGGHQLNSFDLVPVLPVQAVFCMVLNSPLFIVISTTEGPECKNDGLKTNNQVQDLQMISSWLLIWSEYYCCLVNKG